MHYPFHTMILNNKIIISIIIYLRYSYSSECYDEGKILSVNLYFTITVKSIILCIPKKIFILS